MRRALIFGVTITAILAACGTSGAPPAASVKTAPAPAPSAGAAVSEAPSPAIADTSIPEAARPSSATTPPTVFAPPSAAPISTASAVAIDGGCGETPLYAGPGPSDIPGLSANPWSVATPASAGIVAYFWGEAPYLAAGAVRPHRESNKVLWVGPAGSGALTTIVAHPLDDPKAIVRLEFPAGAGPSTVDLPSPGCWRLDLQWSGRTNAVIDVLVAPATTAATLPLATCPVTKPTTPFRAPPPAPASPPAYYHEAWYGNRHLWTMLPIDGQVWSASELPHDRAGIGQKMWWWSADWDAYAEPSPAIAVSGVRLDGGGTFGVNGGTNGTADFGTAMLVGVEFPFAGCWQVTARYRDASLKHVFWLKP